MIHVISLPHILLLLQTSVTGMCVPTVVDSRDGQLTGFADIFLANNRYCVVFTNNNNGEM